MPKNIRDIIRQEESAPAKRGIAGIISASSEQATPGAQERGTAQLQHSTTARKFKVQGMEVDPSLIQQYKIAAAKKGAKLRDLIDEALRDGLQKHRDIL